MQNISDLKVNTIIDENHEAQITLPAWKGFQSRQGFYNGRDKKEVSDGTVKVYIDPQYSDQKKIFSQEQHNAVQYLFENNLAIRDAIMDALFLELPEIKYVYDDAVPEINTAADFKNAIGLSIVHIMDSSKDGIAYVGYELGCEWDVEHGLGIMTHKDRIIEIGQADTAFDSWITYKDNGSFEEQNAKWEKENSAAIARNNALVQKFKDKKNKKPWWKFW